ncbi:anti-sigma B factor RsbW [Brassicibacter mesophilus]|jgi:serine/threonine-protein kinase RsbW|uniref:anti-sigma B factor RsbW n=1 Tax=Brassicibacter mesophilus TaxID=745119 RepID=UPI003D1A1AA0
MANNKELSIQNTERKDFINLSIPNRPEYVGVVRLTTSAIASRLGFDIEEIEDIKVAVAEACTNSLEHGLKEKDENFDIEFSIYEDKLSIVVRDNGEGFDTEQVQQTEEDEFKEKGLGIFIIKSLMDDVEIISNQGKGTEIRMIKKIKDGAK